MLAFQLIHRRLRIRCGAAALFAVGLRSSYVGFGPGRKFGIFAWYCPAVG